MNELELDEIKSLLSKPDLSAKEVALILASTHEINGRIENIHLFNEWIRHRYDYHSIYHEKLIIENIELSDKNLSNIDLRYTEIRDCSFKNCNFSNSSLWDSKINNCVFWGGDFGQANFRGSTITDSKFDDISFYGQICFIETVMKNCRLSIKACDLLELDFTLSNLSNIIITVPTQQTIGDGYTSINPVGLDGNKVISVVNLHSLNLSYAVIQNIKIVNLRIFKMLMDYVNISNSDIINSFVTNRFSFNGCSLNNVRLKIDFFEIYCTRIKQLIKERKLTKSDHEAVSVIRDNFKVINDSSSRRIFNQLEKESLRAIKLDEIKHGPCFKRIKNAGSYFSLSFLKWISGYGESPLRIFIWMFLIILLVGASSFVFNWTCEESLYKNIYLSLITFGTVGYGDITPSSDVGRFVLSLEGISGIFLMSMFVVSLVKKWLED